MDRRAFLVAVGLTLSGCGGSKAGSSPTATSEPTDSNAPSPTTQPSNYTQQFRKELTVRNVDVRTIGSNGIRASLDYVVTDPDRAHLEESLSLVAQAFEPPIANGWDVEGLDVSVWVSGQGEPIATYAIEALWAKQYHEGTIQFGSYRRKALKTLNVKQLHTPTPSPTPSPTPDEPPTVQGFQLGAIDAVVENPYATLEVDYNFEPKDTVDVNPNDDETHEAPTSIDYLAVQVRVTNVGDVRFYFAPSAIDFRNPDGEIEGFREFRDSKNPLNDVYIDPGEQLEGGIPYRVYYKTTYGDLVFDQSVYVGDVTCRFNYDADLAVTI